MRQVTQNSSQRLYWLCKFWIHRLRGLNYFNKSAWMPIENRRVLFARSKKEPVLFYCVGGKLEPGETDEQALVRETYEEVGVELKASTIRHIKTFYGPAPDGRPMRMACYDAEYQGEIAPSSEVEEIAWFTGADKHRTTFMGVLILLWYQTQGLID
jgi:8-oxo-dGTP pyrophosphatase MutT (NUDIX family)